MVPLHRLLTTNI